MTRIKICGLSRPCDIEYANEAKPDYCGFVINVPQSPRHVSVAQVRALVSRLNPAITPVGVFVDQPVELIADLVREGTIAVIQLHGHEDEAYLAALRRLTNAPVMQAFRVTGQADLDRAAQSSADYVLLDNGAGGTGASFDWSLLRHFSRPFFLAGGLGPHNLARAIWETCPFAVDMSSGVETKGAKDQPKMRAAVRIVRACDDTQIEKDTAMVNLRDMNCDDLPAFQQWLHTPHVAKWFHDPLSWIVEIEKQDGEYNWIHHYLVEYAGIPIGFCQYYACKDSDEAWEGYTEMGGSYSIDYLIGETAYLGKGFGKQLVLDLLQKIMRHDDVERIVVQPEPENKASCGVLLSCGFELDAVNGIYVKSVRALCEPAKPDRPVPKN